MTKLYENQYYTSEGELIRWINPDKEFVDSNSKELKKRKLFIE